MADITPYADHDKALLIAQLSQLPDGIQAFLTAEIPTPPTISTPADVDAATIAAGVLSKYMLDLFVPFAGLTPVEMLMRISQLNDWHNASTLAGLQQWAGATPGDDGGGELSDLTIISPQTGATYQPGPVRFQVQSAKGSLTAVSAQQIGGAGGPPFDLDEERGQFWGLTYLRDDGSYTFTVSGAFADDRPLVTKDVSFTIGDEDGVPGETGGDDTLMGLDLLKKVFQDACRRVLSGTGDLGEVIAAARKLRKVPFPGGGGGSSGGGGAAGTWAAQIDATLEKILQEGPG